jgi:hypothetical protein
MLCVCCAQNASKNSGRRRRGGAEGAVPQELGSMVDGSSAASTAARKFSGPGFTRLRFFFLPNPMPLLSFRARNRCVHVSPLLLCSSHLLHPLHARAVSLMPFTMPSVIAPFSMAALGERIAATDFGWSRAGFGTGSTSASNPVHALRRPQRHDGVHYPCHRGAE